MPHNLIYIAFEYIISGTLYLKAGHKIRVQRVTKQASSQSQRVILSLRMNLSFITLGLDLIETFKVKRCACDLDLTWDFH